MKRLLKWLLAGISAIFTLIVLVVVALVWLVDLNAFKPHIEQLAADKAGIELKIEGDLGWSFFPYLGIDFGAMTLRPLTTPEAEPLLSLQQMAAGLAITPLFSGELHLNRIHLIQPEIYLHRDTQGVANWSLLMQAASSDASADTTAVEAPAETADGQVANTTAGFALNLAIDEILLDKARVRYLDEVSEQQLTLSEVTLQAQEVNLQDSFPLQLSARLQLEQPALNLQLAINSRITARLEQQDFRLDDLQLKASLDYPALLTRTLNLDIQGGARINLQEDYASLPLQGQIDQTAFQLTLEATHLSEQPQLQGQLALAIQQLKEQLSLAGISLATADPQVLGPLQLDVQIRATPETLQLSHLTLALDATRFTGQASVGLTNQAVFLRLAGDQLNADRYLPPASTETEVDAAQTAVPLGTTPANTEEADLLPVDLLRTLNLDAELTLQALQIAGLKLEQLEMALTAKEGLIELSQANLHLYEGQFTNEARADLRGSEPQLAFSTHLDGLNLRPLLADLQQENLPLRGIVFMQGEFSSQGNSLSRLLAASQGTGQVQLSQGAVTGINISQMVCNAAASLSEQSSQRQWGPDTEFTNLSADILLQQGQLNNSNLTLAIPGFEVSGLGHYHLLNQDFLYNLGVRFTQDADQQACRVGSHLAAVRWPVECSGSLAGDNPSFSCRPDTAAVGNVLAEMLREEASQQADRLREEAEARIRAEQQRLQERLEREAQERLRSLFR